MALFKIFRGNEEQLPTTKTDGYAYFCTDTGSFFIDHLNNEGELIRSKISANYADKLRETKDGEEIELSAIDITTMIANKPGKITQENGEIFNDYVFNVATGDYSHAEGYDTTASGDYSHAEGYTTTASGAHSHAEGNSTNKAENYIYNEDGSLKTNDEIKSAWNTTKFSLAKGDDSHVEGSNNLALGDYSHAEGNNTVASGNPSHAEGHKTIASGMFSHAEGNGTTASGWYSHAEGWLTTASTNFSHTEGCGTTASGQGSHAEGNGTKASGWYSHVEGGSTIASGEYSHVQGKYNIEDKKNKYAHIVGNGTSSNRSNAHTVDWDGNAWFAGNITVGANSDNVLTGSQESTVSNITNYQEVNNKLSINDFASGNSLIDLTIGGRTHCIANEDGTNTLLFANSFNVEELTDSQNISLEIADKGLASIPVEGSHVYQDSIKLTKDKAYYTEEVKKMYITQSNSVSWSSNSTATKGLAFVNLTGAKELTSEEKNMIANNIEIFENHNGLCNYFTCVDKSHVQLLPGEATYLYQSSSSGCYFRFWFAIDMTNNVFGITNEDSNATKVSKILSTFQSNNMILLYPKTTSLVKTEETTIENINTLFQPLHSNKVTVQVSGENGEQSITDFSIHATYHYNVVDRLNYINNQSGYAIKGFHPQSQTFNERLDTDSDVSGKIVLDSVEGIEVGMYYNIYYPIFDATTGIHDFEKWRGEIIGVNRDTNEIEYSCKKSNEFKYEEQGCTLPITSNSMYGNMIIHGGIIGSFDIEFSKEDNVVFNAQGLNTKAGIDAHAEGVGTQALNFATHAEGYYTTATGERSHAEGYKTIASGHESHAEGLSTEASGYVGHAEGRQSIAIGDYSHAEGHKTIASGYVSHAEGTTTQATGAHSHAEGYNTIASNSCSHAEGNNTVASGTNAHVEGNGTRAIGNYSHAEGQGTTASGAQSHAEGGSTNKAVNYIYNEDNSLKTNDKIKSAWNTTKFSLAKGVDSHVEGGDNLALGNYSHAENYETIASGNYSHAEGYLTDASGEASHAEGIGTTASGVMSSHAEGYVTTASGNYSHAEGIMTTASGSNSHAEGHGTRAKGSGAHAEGNGAIASGWYSHVEGGSTIASGEYSHVQGKYNIEDTENKYAHIVGNGTSDSSRSNAHTLDWDGNAWFAGNIKVGGTSYDDASAKELATKAYVDDATFSAMESISPEQHAAVFRGKNLGSAITDAQKAAIADGSFKDLFIGDYWVINNITWRIADMDYWYNTSKNALTRHHLVMIPDTCLFEHIMKNSGSADIPSTTKGGYHLTDMHVRGLNEARSMVINAFGANMCVSHKEAFVNAVTNGKPSSFLFEDSWLDLPTEIMMYGTNIFSVASDGDTPPPAVITYCRTQLALFDIAPKFIVSPRQTYWLRDIVSEGQYAAVNAGGYATHSGSEFSLGVRPVFCIG